MGIKRIKIMEDLPLETGKTYMTKFQTKEMFTVTRIDVDKNGKRSRTVHGIYENHPDIGVCGIDVDRLIADKREIGERDVCDCCGLPIDEKYKGKKYLDF